MSENVFRSSKVVEHDCTVKYTDSDRCIRIVAQAILFRVYHSFGLYPSGGFLVSIGSIRPLTMRESCICSFQKLKFDLLNFVRLISDEPDVDAIRVRVDYEPW